MTAWWLIPASSFSGERDCESRFRTILVNTIACRDDDRVVDPSSGSFSSNISTLVLIVLCSGFLIVLVLFSALYSVIFSFGLLSSMTSRLYGKSRLYPSSDSN